MTGFFQEPFPSQWSTGTDLFAVAPEGSNLSEKEGIRPMSAPVRLLRTGLWMRWGDF